MTNGHRGTVHPSSPVSPDSAAPDQRKAEARAEASARRAEAVRRESAEAAGERLRDRALDVLTLPAGCAVSAYWPMGSEIDPRPLIDALHARGHAIGLPVTVRRGLPLIFRSWEPGVALVSGGFGTRVPGPERPEIRPRVLLVPLLAFDRGGFRLGYGGGFYDRTLATLRATGSACALGLAYAAQEVPQVPRDGHDQRLDWIVTEAEAIEIAPGEAGGGRPA